MREPHRQICPLLRKAERTTVSSSFSRGASAKTRVGFLPPSSSETLRRRAAQAFAMAVPTAVLPVKLIAATSGCSTRAWPADGPRPWTMLSTPAGKPISRASSPSIQAVTGVTSLGLPTTQLPAARAGASFQVNRYSGRFQGLITPATPSGWRRV